MNFIETDICKSRKFCVACRTMADPSWRKVIARQFQLPDNLTDFECPSGIPWDYRGGFRPGDAVAAVAQPIARGIDKVFRTDLAGCRRCKKRQADLNKFSR